MYAHVQSGRPLLVEQYVNFYRGLLTEDGSYDTSTRGASFMRSKDDGMQGNSLGVLICRTTKISM